MNSVHCDFLNTIVLFNNTKIVSGPPEDFDGVECMHTRIPPPYMCLSVYIADKAIMFRGSIRERKPSVYDGNQWIARSMFPCSWRRTSSSDALQWRSQSAMVSQRQSDCPRSPQLSRYPRRQSGRRRKGHTMELQGFGQSALAHRVRLNWSVWSTHALSRLHSRVDFWIMRIADRRRHLNNFYRVR